MICPSFTWIFIFFYLVGKFVILLSLFFSCFKFILRDLYSHFNTLVDFKYKTFQLILLHFFFNYFLFASLSSISIIKQFCLRLFDLMFWQFQWGKYLTILLFGGCGHFLFLFSHSFFYIFSNNDQYTCINNNKKISYS